MTTADHETLQPTAVLYSELVNPLLKSQFSQLAQLLLLLLLSAFIKRTFADATNALKTAVTR